jgi:tRNA modification GTPase
MNDINLNDTIVAIATPIGESGIGIVRMSGKDAISIMDKIFVSKDGLKPSGFKTYTVHYGWIVTGSSRHCVMELPHSKAQIGNRVNVETEVVDEVILTVMRAPRSYTREDIVEINCHGGIVALRRVFELVLKNGARIAQPGEFTRRAFLNGRIDLAQAEAVLDIIRAKTESALRIGTEQLRGALSSKINNLSKELLDLLLILEASIDFPDEEINSVDPKSIRLKIERVNNELKDILQASRHGRILREGINVVICGKPNVGKSSLLNALLKQERSIVTPVAGTTRDTIEEIIDIKGIPIRAVDTAGIIEPRDLVEKKAVLRSKRYIKLAGLVILVFDGSKQLDRKDEVLIRRLRQKPTIAVANKMDLKQRLDKRKLLKRLGQVIDISAKKLKNIELLEEAIVNKVCEGKVIGPEPALVTNLRHIEALHKAQKLIEEAVDSLDNKLSLEFISQDLKDALGCLDSILGRKFSEDLLDKIFSEFCIGK